MVEKVRGTDLPLIAVRMEVGIEFRSRDEDRASTNTEQQGIKWNGWSKAQLGSMSPPLLQVFSRFSPGMEDE
ncbi:uncharacterized [Tachysurus ichikawai]